MDKLLTKHYLGEKLSPAEQLKLDNFFAKHTPWQLVVIRDFYWCGPRYVEERYKVDAYNMLTNMGILEVE